ncbi:MAG TPA: prolipoprotein diacylglyceryl transferase family protein [Candidatus Eisenbacteria bacterium]|nr:prolipoprotein diacylglyceryl transferase family protein [Candidatus Eisenbacteria bacterium]
MHPILIDLPFLRVTSGDAMLLVAVVFTWWIGPRWAASLEGLDVGRVRRASVVLSLVALAGARAHFALNFWNVYADHPVDVLKPWIGGFHVGGAVIALVAAAPWVTRRQGLPLGKFGDGVTPVVGVALAIQRVGCLLHGCCFGTTCDWPWAITFPPQSAVYATQEYLGWLEPGATRSLPVHPLQIYFMAAGLALAAVALWVQRRKRYDGQVALVGLVVLSASAAGLEFFRGEFGGRVWWGSLPQLEWTALAMLAAAFVALAAAEMVHRRQRVAVGALVGSA